MSETGFSPNEQEIAFQEAHAKLDQEQSVLFDKLSELGIAEEKEEYISFLKSIGKNQAEFILQLIDQKIWSELETIKEKLESFKENFSITLSDQEAKIFLTMNPETNDIDYEKAKEMNLELNLIRGSEAAGRLLQEVVSNKIDINTEEGQQSFIKQWKKECPNLPMPCVPPNDFWYLQQLQAKRIISNIENPLQGQPNQSAAPRFQEDEFLFVDNWQEEDWDNKKAKKSHYSELLEDMLNNKGSTVRIRRQDIDQALWEGDPANRMPTEKHKEALGTLGCDPKEFELRLIRQDEYARLAPTKGYGQKNLWTNFDNYFLGGDGDRCGLDGGYRGDGDASNGLWLAWRCGWRSVCSSRPLAQTEIGLDLG